MAGAHPPIGTAPAVPSRLGDLQMAQHLGEIGARTQHPLALADLANRLLRGMPVPLHCGHPPILGDSDPQHADSNQGPTSLLQRAPAPIAISCPPRCCVISDPRPDTIPEPLHDPTNPTTDSGLERARVGSERLAARGCVSPSCSLRSRAARATASLSGPQIPRELIAYPLGLLERARVGSERLAARGCVSRSCSLRSRAARATASLSGPQIPRELIAYPLGLLA